MKELGTIITLNGINPPESRVSTRVGKGKSLLAFPDDYVSLDLETTGLDALGDSIIELAAVRVRGRCAVDQYTTLVNPHMTLDSFITELTGITNEMVMGAPDLESVFQQFMDFIGDDTVVGHNVNFDINFLYESSMHITGKPFKNDFVDTLRLSKRIFKGFPNHKLATLVQQFGIATQTAHRALADSLDAHRCIEYMRTYVQSNNLDMFAVFTSDYNIRAKNIVAREGFTDETNPLYGKVVVFTGTLEKMLRKEAMQFVADIGGVCGDSVTAKTNILVLGNYDYCQSIKSGEKSGKYKRAEQLQLEGKDIIVISENTFYDMASESHLPDQSETQTDVPTNAKDLAQYSVGKVEELIVHLVETYNLPQAAFEFKKTAAYRSLHVRTLVAFRFKLTGSEKYLSFPAVLDKNLPPHPALIKDKTTDSYLRLPLASADLSDYLDLIKALVLASIARFPKEWDCCSRYAECSDVRRCIHPDADFAFGCGYKRLLESGKVFYGKHRNVD